MKRWACVLLAGFAACKESVPPSQVAPVAHVAEKKVETTVVKAAVPVEVQAEIDTCASHVKPIEERQRAVQKLAELGHPAAVVPLAAMLQPVEGSEALVPALREALVKLKARDVLVEKLASPSKEEKLLALELLGLLRDASAHEAIAARLADAEPKVRAAAAASLGYANDQRAVPVLVPALGDADADVRMAAAMALGLVGGPEALAALESALKQEQDSFVKLSIESGITQAKAPRQPAPALPAKPQ